jgi:shikimate dehydrogenase
MPGAGKTSLGLRIAEQLQRPFFDSDEILAQEQGCSPGDLILQYGEEAFRSLESEVIARLAKRQGVVIATGGGSILKQENRDALQQNGIVVWIQRDLTKLSPKVGRYREIWNTCSNFTHAVLLFMKLLPR